jgi:DNA-binding XRE family transcriptional regulator
MRLNHALTQMDFSKKAGINITTLCQIENRNIKVSDKIMNRILAAFSTKSVAEAISTPVIVKTDETSKEKFKDKKKPIKTTSKKEVKKSVEAVGTKESNEKAEIKEDAVHKVENNIICFNTNNISVLKNNIKNYLQYLDLMYVKLKAKIENDIKNDCSENDLIHIINTMNIAIDDINKICK